MLGRRIERSLGGLITAQMELLWNDGRSVNTGFHNGVFTGEHQDLGFYFPLGGGRGCQAAKRARLLPSPESKPCVFPTSDNRWQQKHTLTVLIPTAAESSVTKGTYCSSVALIPGSRNETASHRNASLHLLTAGYFTLLEGCGLLMGRVQVWAWWDVSSPYPHQGASSEITPVSGGTSSDKEV